VIERQTVALDLMGAIPTSTSISIVYPVTLLSAG
jgi:hypothetical protein